MCSGVQPGRICCVVYTRATEIKKQEKAKVTKDSKGREKEKKERGVSRKASARSGCSRCSLMPTGYRCAGCE